MVELKIHRDAKADLDAIWGSDPDAAALLQTLLQEAKSNPIILSTFSVHDFGSSATNAYHISRWEHQQQQGRNLWRLKIWELEQEQPRYRVVYAFHPQKDVYHVLGIFTRDFNYDEHDTRTQRVLAVYERLDIPVYRW